jgi:hypothetical protein
MQMGVVGQETWNQGFGGGVSAGGLDRRAGWVWGLGYRVSGFLRLFGPEPYWPPTHSAKNDGMNGARSLTEDSEAS